MIGRPIENFDPSILNSILATAYDRFGPAQTGPLPSPVMIEWIGDHPGLLIGAFGLSLALFIASLIAVPIAITRIPADYFTHEHRPRSAWQRFPAIVRILFVGARSLIAVILIVAGIAMLALPGQGLLTIVIGIFLLDFPGKYALERRIIRRDRVRALLNRLRRRRRVPPLEHPDRPDAPTARKDTP